METMPVSFLNKLGQGLNIALFLGILVLSALAAIRNLRHNRGDRRGALRIAVLLFTLQVLLWVFLTHHTPTREEFSIFLVALQGSFFVFAMAWLFYMAVEPTARRLYPERIITWVRVLDNRFLDPLVGRDILFGTLAGALIAAVTDLRHVVATALGLPSIRPDTTVPLGDALTVTGVLLAQIHSGIFSALLIFTFLVLLRVLLRRHVLATGLLAFLILLIVGPQMGAQPADYVAAALMVAILFTTLLRVGLLAAVCAFTVMVLTGGQIGTFNAASWYSAESYAVLAVILGMGIYGFVVSLGGRNAFAGAMGEE
jgi:hypothetical protein